MTFKRWKWFLHFWYPVETLFKKPIKKESIKKSTKKKTVRKRIVKPPPVKGDL